MHPPHLFLWNCMVFAEEAAKSAPMLTVSCSPLRNSEAFAVILIFVFWTVAYYLTSSKVTAKATVLFATTASFGMLVTWWKPPLGRFLMPWSLLILHLLWNILDYFFFFLLNPRWCPCKTWDSLAWWLRLGTWEKLIAEGDLQNNQLVFQKAKNPQKVQTTSTNKPSDLPTTPSSREKTRKTSPCKSVVAWKLRCHGRQNWQESSAFANSSCSTSTAMASAASQAEGLHHHCLSS